MGSANLLAASALIEKLFTPPTAGRSTLLEWILNLTFLVHLPFMGLVIAGTTLSLILNVLNRQDGGRNHLRLSKDLLEMVTFNHSVGLVLGILPLFALVTVYGQVVHAAHKATYLFWFATIVLATLGLAHIYFHRTAWAMRERRWFFHFAIGAGGVGLLSAAYLLLFSTVQLAATPERWPLVNDFTEILFSWNCVFRFAQFGAMSWAILGAAILMRFFHSEERRKAMDEEYAAFVRRIGLGVGLAFIVPVPLLLFVELYNNSNFYFPGGSALTPIAAAFDSSIVALLLCMAVGHLLYMMIVKRELKLGPHVFILCLGVFGAWIVGGQTQMRAALREHAMALDERAEDARKAQKAALPGAGPVDGQEVFLRVCTACHDPSLVVDKTGPGLLSRLPKYRGDPARLVKWIREGGKTGDPKFPEGMAPPAVKPYELEPVADYMLKRLEEGK